MPSKIPPGLSYFFRRLGVTLLPAIAVFASARVLAGQRVLELATAWVALAAIASVPAAHAARIMYWSWSVKRRAARMGAVLPPSWEGTSIGNMDILKRGMVGFYRGYPGAYSVSSPCIAVCRDSRYHRWAAIILGGVRVGDFGSESADASSTKSPSDLFGHRALM